MTTPNTLKSNEAGLNLDGTIFIVVSPVGGNGQIGLEGRRAPSVGSVTDPTQGRLVICQKQIFEITTCYLKILFQSLVIDLPRLHDWSPKCITTRNILILEVLSQEEQELPKLWTFNDIYGLKQSWLRLSNVQTRKHTWSSVTTKFRMYHINISLLKGSRLGWVVDPIEAGTCLPTTLSLGSMMCSLQSCLYKSRWYFLMWLHKPLVAVDGSYCHLICNGKVPGFAVCSSLRIMVRIDKTNEQSASYLQYLQIEGPGLPLHECQHYI